MVKAKEIMNTKVVTIGRGEDLCEAIREMALNNITGLPVVEEDGTLAGMITEKDVLTVLCEALHRPARVEQFMTTKVVYFDQEDSLDAIAESFRSRDEKRVVSLWSKWPPARKMNQNPPSYFEWTHSPLVPAQRRDAI